MAVLGYHQWWVPILDGDEIRRQYGDIVHADDNNNDDNN